MNLEPVGIYRSSLKYRFETPRQGVFSTGSGVIEFVSGRNFETALSDLNGFGRIWILFQFHLNSGWKPKVRPPVAPGNERIGVFATRSPHRPNPIGLSCVRLERVEGLRVFVRDCDLLDETPVFDIKPYIPAADAFPDSETGWLERAEFPRQYEVRFLPDLREKIEFLRERGLDVENFCRLQLGGDPLNGERKRLYRGEHGMEIGFRTWRIVFSVENQIVTVSGIRSNYLPEELAAGAPDRYGDKPLHREFLACFS